MISGRSGLIALITANIDNQFYPLLLEQLSRRLQDKGYSVLRFVTDPGDQDKVVQRIMQYKWKGLLWPLQPCHRHLQGNVRKPAYRL